MSEDQFKRACQIIGELTVENRRRFEAQMILSDALRSVSDALPDSELTKQANAALAKHGL